MLVSVSIRYGSNLPELDPIEIYKRQCLLTTTGYHRISPSKRLGHEARLCRENARDGYDVLARSKCIYEKKLNHVTTNRLPRNNISCCCWTGFMCHGNLELMFGPIE